MASKILVLVLIGISAIVSVLQYKKERNRAWLFIVLYWVVLTAKNICDFLGV